MKISRLIESNNEVLHFLIDKRSSQQAIFDYLQNLNFLSIKKDISGVSERDIILSIIRFRKDLNLKNLSVLFEKIEPYSDDQKAILIIDAIFHSRKINIKKIIFFQEQIEKLKCSNHLKHSLILSFSRNKSIATNPIYAKYTLMFFKKMSQIDTTDIQAYRVFKKLIPILKDKSDLLYILNYIKNRVRIDSKSILNRLCDQLLYRSSHRSIIFQKMVVSYSLEKINRNNRDLISYKNIEHTPKFFFRLLNLKGIDLFCRFLKIRERRDLFRPEFEFMPKTIKSKISRTLEYNQKIRNLRVKI